MKKPFTIIIPVILSAIAVAIYFTPYAAEVLQWDRDLIGAGEFWRIFTGHWTHFTGSHLLWDVAVFLVLSIACCRRSCKSYPLLLGVSSSVISIAVWYGCPQLAVYRGLSGIDTALYCWFVSTMSLDGLRKRDGLIFSSGVLMLVCMIGKSVFELMSGQTIFVDSVNFVGVPLAHLAGAAAAILVISGDALIRSIHSRGKRETEAFDCCRRRYENL